MFINTWFSKIRLKSHGIQTFGFIKGVYETNGQQPWIKSLRVDVEIVGDTDELQFSEVLTRFDLSEKYRFAVGSPLPIRYSPDTKECIIDDNPDFTILDELIARYDSIKSL